MIKYYELLHEKNLLNHKIKEEQKSLGKQLRQTKKRLFRTLDFCLVLIILFNVGAIVITNMMVYEKAEVTNKPIMMKEVNPVAAEVHNLEQHEDSTRLYAMFLRAALIWALMIFIFIYLRIKVYTDQTLFLLVFVIIIWMIATGMDFFNNFGFFIGKILFT